MRSTFALALVLTEISRGQSVTKNAIDNFNSIPDIVQTNITLAKAHAFTGLGGASYQNFLVVPGSYTDPWSYVPASSHSNLALLRSGTTGYLRAHDSGKCIKVHNITIGCAIYGVLMAPSPRSCNITLTTIPPEMPGIIRLRSHRQLHVHPQPHTHLRPHHHRKPPVHHTYPYTQRFSFTGEQLIEGMRIVPIQLPFSEAVKLEVVVREGILGFKEEIGRDEWGPIFKTHYESDKRFLAGLVGAVGYEVGMCA